MALLQSPSLSDLVTGMYMPRVTLSALVVSFAVTFAAMPFIISYAKKQRWHDVPDRRPFHDQTPVKLGGLAIFLGFLTSVLVSIVYLFSVQIFALLFSLVILCISGLAHDISKVTKYWRLMLQIAAGLLVAGAGFRLQSLNGFMGIYELSLTTQYLLTVLLLVVSTNSWYLVDTVDGAAGGLAIMNSMVLCYIFYMSNDLAFVILSLALLGAMAAYLKYNYYPARIFMGFTGAKIIGFVQGACIIEMINQNPVHVYTVLGIPNPILLASALLAVPVFDALRTYLVLILKRRPFKADHSKAIHHLLIKTRHSHLFVSSLLYAVNLIVLVLAFTLTGLRTEVAVLLLVSTVVLLLEGYTLFVLLYKHPTLPHTTE